MKSHKNELFTRNSLIAVPELALGLNFVCVLRNGLSPVLWYFLSFMCKKCSENTWLKRLIHGPLRELKIRHQNDKIFIAMCLRKAG